ncbi:microtubule-associated protein futsch isoform X3 [Episyrphus balteatus]|uniref:microtubule-associated protein futsch isoform X3 n=1 Tax=Episyrphus balteatus TaxID=286459 RepID=UPI0024857F57|nr:microtubule-associated protein futsch isoform X3 [Episyrphus balteatus]
MSDTKNLLNSLLKEIYSHIPAKPQKKKMHPKLYEKRLLEKLSPKVLEDICEILKFEIRLISKYLERVLISRDKNRTYRTILCGFLDILVSSSKFGESSREMRFGISSPPGAAATTQKGRGDVATTATASAASAGRPIIADETNSSSDFNQWLHAMKMVARLPGGMPPEFRRKLWLALADKYLKSKNVDWEKEEVKCFSEQWREDDEELGIQIVKDLHRTGSSLCSGPAGTINQAKLKRILLGYARFNPEVGYCQGFNMLGALILQVMDKEEIESIKVMIYLVEGILPSGYFSGSLGGLQADMAVFRELMTSKLPRLAKHLQKLQGPVENAFEPPLTNVFTMQWFLTMFCTCLPMTCVLRVWDLVLIEGSDVLLRTALVLWSLLEERILNARTADDFYCQMGSFSSELLNGHLVDSNGLIEKVVDLGPITDLQKLRDKHLYNITPFRDKKGLQLYYSDEDGDDDDEESKMAVATAWGLRLRRGSAGLGSKSDGKDRIALDISLLKKQYDRLRERQRQAHIILTSAVARQGANPNQSSIQMNQLLMGRNAIVTNNGRRLGPPQGAIPPARKPSLPTSKPPKLAQTKKLLSGETLHWRDTDLSKRRRGSLKWKDIKSDSSQSGMEDRPPTLVESAPSSRSSSSEPKASKRPSLKASRQRSDSSSYSEESDGNSSTDTSLCDEDENPDHNVSSLEGSPMRKSKSSKKHSSEVTKQKSLEDVLNSNDGQPVTVDNQIPFIQLTTIESPVLNANKTDIEPLEYGKEDSETESNRLDYAGFVDEFSWPDINEQPTTSVSLEDTTVDAISEGDFLSLSNVITSTSQLSPIPDITTYINNSNISPLRTPISGFDYANLVTSMNDSKKFDVNEEGVTNEYFERVNVVERPTKLDLLYSLNEEDSIRNAYVSCEPSFESSKDVEKVDQVESEVVTKQPSDEELDRKMKVLQEYSNKSSLSFIAEAKHEISSGMFKEVEFDADSLKYQPSTLVPIRRPPNLDSSKTDDTSEHVIAVPVIPKTVIKSDLQSEAVSPPKNLAEELLEIELQESAAERDKHIKSKEENERAEEEKPCEDEVKTSKIPSTEDLEERFRVMEDNDFKSNVSRPEKNEKTVEQKPCEDEVKTNNIPSTEDLEERFRVMEMNFSGRKESLINESTKTESPNTKEVLPTESSYQSSRNSVGKDGDSKDHSPLSKGNDDFGPSRKSSASILKEEDDSNPYESLAAEEKDQEDIKNEDQSIASARKESVEAQENLSSHQSTEYLEQNKAQRRSSLQSNQSNEDINRSLPEKKESEEYLSSQYSDDNMEQSEDQSISSYQKNEFSIENQSTADGKESVEDQDNFNSMYSAKYVEPKEDQNVSSLQKDEVSNEDKYQSVSENNEIKEDHEKLSSHHYDELKDDQRKSSLPRNQSKEDVSQSLPEKEEDHEGLGSHQSDEYLERNEDQKRFSLQKNKEEGQEKLSSHHSAEDQSISSIDNMYQSPSEYKESKESSKNIDTLSEVAKYDSDFESKKPEDFKEKGSTYSQVKESLNKDLTAEDPSSVTNWQERPNEDMKKYSPMTENQEVISNYSKRSSLEDELMKRKGKEEPQSSNPKEKENEDSKTHRKQSDPKYQYAPNAEESNKVEISEDKTEEFNRKISISNSGDEDIVKETKEFGVTSEDIKKKDQFSTLEESSGDKKTLVKEETVVLKNEDLSMSSKTRKWSTEDLKPIDIQDITKSDSYNQTISEELADKNIQESSVKDSKSASSSSERNEDTGVKKQTTPIKEEELSRSKCLKTNDEDKIPPTSQQMKVRLPSSDDLQSDSKYQSTIEDSIVKNLSDDRKQSMLPKDVKHKLKELPNEGALYYEHHPANEETRGENDPNQPKEDPKKDEPKSSKTASPQEKPPIEETSSDSAKKDESKESKTSSPQEKPSIEASSSEQEKSIVPSSTDKPDNKELKKLEDFGTNTTIVDRPVSTYSFSYTQDHFKDHVSFLSEVQSSNSTHQKDPNAIQSTFDLKHSPNLVAVTTSVSLKNASSVKSSLSVKSSVSLKSSALYDRERSLHFNTGITVFEDSKLDASKMITSNQLESNQKSNNENFRISQNLLADNQNNGVTVSVIKSGYNDLNPSSNISLSMQLPSYSGVYFDRNHSKPEAILGREALQILDESSPASSIKEDTSNNLKPEVIESSNDKAVVKVVEESQKRKLSYSQEVEERLKALERRLSDRALLSSKDTKAPVDQPKKEEKEPTKKEEILTLDDVQPMKLKDDASSQTESKQEKEVKPTEDKPSEVKPTEESTQKVVPSTADLEKRFEELERKLSEKNIHLSEVNRNEKPQKEDNKANSNLNPSIVLPKNEDTSRVRECDDGSSAREKDSKTNEDQPTSTTRRRIPSTEDLESRFEALEIQKSLKSPTNLLSPSKIKEDFLAASPTEQDSKRKSEIPSTEDLENRFQALEQSKTSTKSKEFEEKQITKTPTKEKTKDVPKVTFADTSDVKKSPQKSSELTETDEELCTKSSSCEPNRILRKVPSARDLEARFEALEKRKSFTGFSTKTQEHLLAEQNRNYLSSESLNTVEGIKRREILDKKVASTEDLVLRLDALEQRMAITENSIKNKISAETTSDLSPREIKKPSPSKLDFECRFEALDHKPPFKDHSGTKENTNTNKTKIERPKPINIPKDASPETKLNLIKRSLFEDTETEVKWLPSTEDLEIRFDILEMQKTRALKNKKKITSEKEDIKPKPTKSSTENWETRFEAFEHRTPKSIPYATTTTTIPRWENEVQSKFPSTRDLETRFEALEQQKSNIERSSSKLKEFQKQTSFFTPTKPIIQKNLEPKPTKALSSRSIDQVLEQISTKTEEIEREHRNASKLPSTQDLEIRYNDLQINSKRGDDENELDENVENLEQTTDDSLELTGTHKRRDLYKLESQSDETLTVSNPTGTEFETKSESRPTSCPEYRDPFDTNVVTTDRTLADSGGGNNDYSAESVNSPRSGGFTDSLLALGNIFPRNNDESISPSRIKSQSSRVRSTITFRSEDSSITDRLASIKSTIKSIDTLCEDQSSRKDKCQRYIDSLFTTSTTSPRLPSSSNATSPIPPLTTRPLIRVDDFEGRQHPPPPSQDRVAMRELKKEASPRRRRDEDREEYESRVRRDMMPNSVVNDAPSEFSCSLENIAKVDSEVDRINQKDKKQVVETQLERPLSPYYAPGYDLNNRSTTPTVYVPTKLEIRHTTVTSTFYDRFLTEKHIERTFPRSKKHSPVSPTITKSHLDISNYNSLNLEDRSSKSAENSPSRRKDGISPNQNVSAAAYRRSFISSLEVAQKDLHIRSCDNILLQLRSSTQHNNSNSSDVVPSIMVYNPLPTKIRKSPELGISLGLYNKDYGSDASSKS